ncbi:hypothetical protein QQP08_013377 [Theobroma cacao]|nr:hypothetical protein QQP08_013377 [Theobroma cacao]
MNKWWFNFLLALCYFFYPFPLGLIQRCHVYDIGSYHLHCGCLLWMILHNAARIVLKVFYGNVNNHRNRVTGMQAPMPVVGIVDSSESSPRRVKFSHFNINVNSPLFTLRVLAN